jgi:hypothetical protein
MDRKNINRGFKKLRVWPPARRAYAPEGKMPFLFMLFHDSNIPSFHVGAIKPVSLKTA